MKSNNIKGFNTSLLIALFLSLTSYGQLLETHRWTNRVLLVYSSSPNSKDYKNQMTVFNSSDKEFAERKLVLYTLSNDSYNFKNYSDTSLNYTAPLIEDLKKHISTKKEFEIILIGLDGGIKLRQNSVLRKDDLFALIDSMPMRRNERKN